MFKKCSGVCFRGGGGRNAQSPVRAKFRCRVGVGQWHIQCVQYKTITPMECPHFSFCLHFKFYAFSRCFYPKRLTGHSGYTFSYQYVVFTKTNVCVCVSVRRAGLVIGHSGIFPVGRCSDDLCYPAQNVLPPI